MSDPDNKQNNEDQPDLIPAEENGAAPEQPSAGGGNGGARQFSPLPALPEGDEVPIAQYAERAYLEYAVSWSRAARCRT